MVSKVAVIALVAIVACPILLGFGMNLTEQTVNEYKPGNDSVNVTQFLQNDVDYYTTNTDPVTINTNWRNWVVSDGVPVLPQFSTINSNYSSIQTSQYAVYGSNWIPSGISVIHDYNLFDLKAVYTYDDCSLDLTIHYTDSTTTTINHIIALSWDGTTGVLSYYVAAVGRTVITDATGIYGISFSTTGTYIADSIFHYDNKNVTPQYADLSAGYYLAISGNGYYLSLPDYQSIVFTMDLSSLAYANYGIQLVSGSNSNRIAMVKTTDGDGIHWSLYRVSSGIPTTKITDLYYDSTRSSNTYQIYYDDEKTQFRYVGDWPKVIGLANYYRVFDVPAAAPDNLGTEFAFVHVANDTTSKISPLMRIDWSQYSSTQYSIIEDQTYDPAGFKNNPYTTLNNPADGSPTRYGSSITFGGVTYAVTDGNITLGAHQISLRGLTFASYPVAGGYENRIGGVAVSTTAQPSTITFGGKWNVSIATAAMEQNTYTHTEWTPGQFAWDGIDQNFLIVGLITSLGVFVALGIYARKSRSGGIIPLMIVTGCAAALFFIML